MGATRLLGHLRRLRRPPAAAQFHASQSPRPFPLRGLGATFSPCGHRHSPSASPRHHRPFPGGWRQFSSWGEPDGRVCPEDGAAGDGEVVSVGGADLSGPAIDGGEDSAWYAPVRAVISLLDGYHEATGLPWWIIIATSTLALRMSLLPVLLFQFKKMRKLSELFPKLPPPLPPPFSGKGFIEQFLLFRKKRLELGCPSYLWNFAFVSVQGGILWFQNLTEFPHGVLGSIFPLLVAGLHFINVQISFQTVKLAEIPGIFGLLARYYKLYLDILSLPLLLIGFNVPQGCLVYWVTNSSFTLVQQLCLRNQYIRKNLGLPESTSAVELKKPKEDHLLEQNIAAHEQNSTEHRSPEELLQLALNHMNMQHQDKALPLLQLAIEKDPELVKAFIALGQISCSRGLLAEAAEYFECALSKTKEQEVDNLILASYGAGFSHLNQGRKEEGIEHLKRIAQLKEPENPADRACYHTGLVLLGSTLYNEGNKSEAARYLRMAAAYDPGVNMYLKECEQE